MVICRILFQTESRRASGNHRSEVITYSFGILVYNFHTLLSLFTLNITIDDFVHFRQGVIESMSRRRIWIDSL